MESPASPARPVYRDPTATIAERVADLLPRLSLDEKVAQVLTLWDGKGALLDGQRRLVPERLTEAWPHGIGQVARPADSKGEGVNSAVDGRGVRATVELVNAYQQHAREHTRHGIPVLFHEEGLHGYAAPEATSFPQALAQAQAWDRDLVRDCNAVTAREMRARGVHLALTPVLDIARDPRWGRIEETFGEDPYLVTELGVAAVQGLQGDGETLAPHKVFATLKHLAGHGEPEGGLNVGPAPIAERELREAFLPPFEAAVKRAGARVVMASYNEIDGLPSHANPWLLNEVLRGEWGFQGAVVGDYFAVDQLQTLHQLAGSLQDAAVLALQAGVDSDLPNGASYIHLKQAVEAGQVPLALLDQAVARLLDLKFRAGLFDESPIDPATAGSLTHDAQAQALALTSAERCIVLLKNTGGVLPLALPAAGARKPVLGVIGPNAAVARLGSYSGTPPQAVSLLEGLRARAGDRMELRHAAGVRLTEGDDWWADEVHATPDAVNDTLIAEAVALARGCDLLVLAVGDDERTAREAWATHHLGDRASIGLPGRQAELFNALQATGRPVVVVFINGRPASEPRIAEQAAAIVQAGFLGEQGGHALARVLFGDVNPGGKLPLSIAQHVGTLPVFYNHKPSARRGYLWDEVKPLFPFGFGLSYTRFECGAPQLSAPTMARDGAVEVSVTVRNVGERAGDEVVQLYVHDLVASVTRPVLELKGFQRVTLAPGASTTVRFTLGAAALAFWNARLQRVVEPGEFDVLTGPGSTQLQGVRLTVTR